MLFYEPLFLLAFPAFYALYLLTQGTEPKKWALLIASALFYLWGEPVFVLVLLASTAFDYVLSFQLAAPTPLLTRRLALAAGVAGNLLILVVYKYADFLADNLNLVLSPFGAHQLPLLGSAFLALAVLMQWIAVSAIGAGLARKPA